MDSLCYTLLLCFSIIQHKSGCSHKNWGDRNFCATHADPASELKRKEDLEIKYYIDDEEIA